MHPLVLDFNTTNKIGSGSLTVEINWHLTIVRGPNTICTVYKPFTNCISNTIVNYQYPSQLQSLTEIQCAGDATLSLNMQLFYWVDV